MRQAVSGEFAWSPGEEADSNRRRVVQASPPAVNAHQPPKRGERRDGILDQCYETIEYRIIGVGCGGRVGVNVGMRGMTGKPGPSKFNSDN